MWKKDNQDSAKAHAEARPRDTSGLGGVGGNPDGTSASAQQGPSGSGGKPPEPATAPLSASPLGAAAQAEGRAADAPLAATSAQTPLPGSGDGGGQGGGDVPPSRRAEGAESAEWRPMLRFDGRGGEYFFLLLKNFLLSLITLGIYSFWGKTRQRVYLWSHTHLWGEPLEYTGTGKELFFSFLIVMPVFLVLFFASGVVFQFIPVLGPLLFYLAFLFAWQFASYRALRFRLTRTRWRGIRGNMSGSALNYAWKGMLYWLAIVCTLGILYPWASARMVKLRMDNVWFGNRRFTFNGPASELYKSFFTVLGLGALIYILFSAIAALVIVSHNTRTDFSYGDPIVSYVALFGALVSTFLVLLVISSFFRAAWFRWFIGHLRTGKLRSRSTLTGARYFRVTLWNIALVVCTLGLGYAWAYLSNLGARLNSVEYAGDPEINTLLQDSMEAPTRGEGLLEVLDVDIGF